MKTPLSRLGLVLLLAGLVLAGSSAAEKPRPGTAPKEKARAGAPSRPDPQAQMSAEKMITALKLKDWGWGKETKKSTSGWENASVDMLLTAARMLKELPPPPEQLEGVTVEVSRNKDAPEGTDTKLSEGQAFNPGKEADVILEQARKIIATDKILDAKKKALYEALIADVEKMPKKTRAASGGPKVVQRAIGPGQTHTYSWEWIPNESGMVSFQSAMPMRIQVVQESGGVIFADSVMSAGTPTFRPSGDKAVKIMVRVQNLDKKQAMYVVGAQ